MQFFLTTPECSLRKNKHKNILDPVCTCPYLVLITWDLQDRNVIVQSYEKATEHTLKKQNTKDHTQFHWHLQISFLVYLCGWHFSLDWNLIWDFFAEHTDAFLLRRPWQRGTITVYPSAEDIKHKLNLCKETNESQFVRYFMASTASHWRIFKGHLHFSNPLLCTALNAQL